MLSVIVTSGDSARLAALVAMLTEASVAGLVREVQILAGPPQPLLAAVCAESGAEPADDFAAALRRARSDLLLLAPPELRLSEGWVERLGDHLREGGRAAVLQGQGGGLFRPGPFGLVASRAQVETLVGPDLKRLRRIIGAKAKRIV